MTPRGPLAAGELDCFLEADLGDLWDRGDGAEGRRASSPFQAPIRDHPPSSRSAPCRFVKHWFYRWNWFFRCGALNSSPQWPISSIG